MINNKCVLVIEDDPALRETLTEMLKEHPRLDGWGILHAANGNEGLVIFTEHRPALVLTDRNMPGKNGPEVTKAIKASVPETKVVGMSGRPDAQQDFEAAGADEFLEKPIALNEFWATVDRLLGL